MSIYIKYKIEHLLLNYYNYFINIYVDCRKRPAPLKRNSRSRYTIEREKVINFFPAPLIDGLTKCRSGHVS